MLDQIKVEDAQFLAGMGCSFLVSAHLLSEMPTPYRGRSSPKEGANGWNPAEWEGVGPRGDTSPLCPRFLQGSGVGAGCSAFAATTEGGSLSHMLSLRKHLNHECWDIFLCYSCLDRAGCLPTWIWAWKTSGERGPVRPRGWQCL